jgi:hypothetical protein
MAFYRSRRIEINQLRVPNFAQAEQSDFSTEQELSTTHEHQLWSVCWRSLLSNKEMKPLDIRSVEYGVSNAQLTVVFIILWTWPPTDRSIYVCSILFFLIERSEGGYRPRGDRDDYRRRDDGEKKEGAPVDHKPEFRSGLGRGRPAAQ